MHPTTLELLEECPVNKVHSGDLPTLGNMPTRLGGLGHSKNGEIHIVEIGGTYKAGKTSHTHDTYNSRTTFPWIISVLRRNPVMTSIPLGPSGITPPTILLTNYEQLR